MKKLTARQQRFVTEFLTNGNATQAAALAGFSKKTARQAGARMLSNVAVCDKLEESRKRAVERAEIAAADVLKELARIGFSDMRSFVEWSRAGVGLKDCHDLTDEQARCVAEVSQTVTKEGGTVRFKLHDKVTALTLLGKHLGMFAERHVIDWEKATPDDLAAIAAGRVPPHLKLA